MNTTIYANYGCLTREYTTVYTTAPAATAVTSEPVEVIIPDEFEPYITKMDQVALTLDGMTCLLGEVLGQHEGAPTIRWYNGESHRWRLLRTVDSAEK